MKGKKRKIFHVYSFIQWTKQTNEVKNNIIKANKIKVHKEIYVF